MEKKVQEKLEESLNYSFGKALKDVIGEIATILESNLKSNTQDGQQVQETILTLKPALRIEFTSPAKFKIKASCPTKNIKTATGEYEMEFDCNQPDLFEKDGDEEGNASDDEGGSQTSEDAPQKKRGRKPKNEQTAA